MARLVIHQCNSVLWQEGDVVERTTILEADMLIGQNIESSLRKRNICHCRLKKKLCWLGLSFASAAALT